MASRSNPTLPRCATPRCRPFAALIRCFIYFRLRRFPFERRSIITLDLRSVRLGFAEAALFEGGGETKRRIGWNLTLDRQKPETGKAEVGMGWRFWTASAHYAAASASALSAAFDSAFCSCWKPRLHCFGRLPTLSLETALCGKWQLRLASPAFRAAACRIISS